MRTFIQNISILTLLAFSTAQISVAQTYCTGDGFYLHAEDYISGSLQWQYSSDNINWNDYTSATETVYNLIITEEIYIRLQITDLECLPSYYTNIRHIELQPQPDNSNAGEDQLDIGGTITTLNANSPSEGTGFWSITSGEGGNITDVYSNTSTFTGAVGTTYTLRWLIYNDCGYAEDFITISFAENSFSCGDILLDTRDGQSYPTVEIGDKCWMAANLNIGTQLIGSASSENNSTIEKFCYSDNPDNCITYGALYQWNEAMDYSTTESTQGICPSGWHVPSDQEVKELEISVGMTQSDADIENNWRGIAEQVGTKMKAGGSSGFEVLMAGVRTSSGTFAYLEGNSVEFGYIWASTEATNTAYAYRRCWRTSSVAVGRYDTFNKFYSYPVRCVKD